MSCQSKELRHLCLLSCAGYAVSRDLTGVQLQALIPRQSICYCRQSGGKCRISERPFQKVSEMTQVVAEGSLNAGPIMSLRSLEMYHSESRTAAPGYMVYPLWPRKS